MSQIDFSSGAPTTVDEFIDFLTRSDLGRQYPRQRFHERIEKLLRHASIQITARCEGRLIGVCNGLTDFAYFLFITDLGVDRDFRRRGIGRRLLELARETAGGANDIAIITLSHSQSAAFYERCGLKEFPQVYGDDCREWDAFDVRDLKASKK
ncbi:GNAT family N-acetyltransferase [Planctomicrobium piriforme]|uniref:Acetyltransferase (GNAT) family protein n=1 Tax=Planctomicrobium piriforme TaxID=1576369 RepID=A0A1I3MKJ1_9PLAN|nr:GNAT family N-acetyltransferase [Planctomicrobium piriforme]SFI97441.1 Acetyltransferase (GNAT) family protein [Planctomicrobium piriforme]